MASTKNYDVRGAGLLFNLNIYSMDLIQPYFKDKIYCMFPKKICETCNIPKLSNWSLTTIKMLTEDTTVCKRHPFNLFLYVLF